MRPLLTAFAVAGALACDRPDDRHQLPTSRATPRPAAGSYQRTTRGRPTTFVRQHDPERSSPGYTLVLERRREPALVARDGRVVHRWPGLDAIGRARLDRHGNLLVIGRDESIREHAWDGSLIWQYRLPPPGGLIHHDVIRLASSNILTLVRENGRATDDLLEVDRTGREVWRWCAADHLDAFEGTERHPLDPVHLNSVHELADNPHWLRGDERFRPGNLLVSARNVSTVFVVDRASGEVVWQHNAGLDYQHEALMIAAGHPQDGNILVFDNGFRRAHDLDVRQSSVVEIEPVSGAVVWRFTSPQLFSAVGGAEQPLPNGNVLISSSEGGRVLEVTRTGDIVWEWVPPWLPMRAWRYPVDHCPQLAAFSDSEPPPVAAPRVPHIDYDLHRFGLPEHVRMGEVAGRFRFTLHDPNGCRWMVVPPRGLATFEFGLDGAALRDARCRVRFRASIRLADGDRSIRLVDETVVAPSDEMWLRRDVSLAELALQRVCVCLETTSLRGRVRQHAIVWANPVFESADLRVFRRSPRASQVARLELKQLAALGYVN